MASVDLSIIIPTHNSALTIEKCINSLASQSYPREKYEIIIVDDGSKDDTVNLAKKAGADNIIKTESCFQGKARNIGVQNSKANLLAFIDSDCEAKEGWIESIVEHLPKVHAMTGPILNGNSQSIVAWGEYFMEFGGFHEHQKRSLVRFLPGCNQAYRKEVFLKTNGFTEKRSSEDVLFGQSLKEVGIQASFIPQTQIQHLCRTSLDKVLSNMRMLGKYSVRTRKESPSIKYSYIMTRRWSIPLLFFGKIGKCFSYAVGGKKIGKFIISFPAIILASFSFCRGIWGELGAK